MKQINSSKAYLTEDLYKIKEAMFNPLEEDVIDSQITWKFCQAVFKIAKACNSEQYATEDPNFIYDCVALLATTQSQHFFNSK